MAGVVTSACAADLHIQRIDAARTDFDQDDRVHIAYDTVSRAIGAHDSPEAKKTAAGLDAEVVKLLSLAASGRP
jgi:hypothetical protein